MKSFALPIQSGDNPSAVFSTYFFRNTKSANLLLVLLGICQFAIFKFFYPFPDFFSDSYSYIYAALAHLDVNIWPIGYSRFLYIFHWFTHSATALNLFQYLFFELSALHFYRTLLFLFPTSKTTRIVLQVFFFFNPLNLYLSNFVSSDALFAALSLFWLTELIWIIYRPNWYHLVSLSIACFIAFTFRYNAMFYPLISVPAFLISKQKPGFKITGILLGPALIIPFILFSSNAARTMSGTPQFPPILGGWQWANNALYMREYIREDSNRFPSPQMTELDQIAREYYRNVPPENRELSSYVGNFFIKEWNAPLKIYMARHTDSIHNGDVVAWARVAPLFKQYGLYLIKRHPVPFLRYFILINTKNYFLPPLEKLEIYNLGEDRMASIAAHWFGYSSRKVSAVSKTFHGYLLSAYPAFFLLLNLFFGWNLYTFLRKKVFQQSERKFTYAIGLLSALILINAAFSIFANIVVFRYQIFPMITLLAIVLLLTDSIEKKQSAALQSSPL